MLEVLEVPEGHLRLCVDGLRRRWTTSRVAAGLRPGLDYVGNVPSYDALEDAEIEQ